MKQLISALLLLMSMLPAASGAQAGDVTREQLKGLDEQVQEIKTDVLAIAAELSRLEERLLFPSTTQAALFISLAEGETFRLDAVEIQLDGQPAAHHIYTFKELEALRKGGVQRIYTGNLRTGNHDLQISMIGQSDGGGELRKTGQFTVNKGVGPKIVEIRLAAQEITVKD
ncbi:MAG: hypothetical protein HKP58_17415 [Desulfatitalea sp.]|nr:hypothetical protein [Desulfatitalea sp.]NNK02193.1 hypothetical protein [Desulfatitalea sp.]